MAIVRIDGQEYVTDTDTQCADCGFYFREFGVTRAADGQDYCAGCYPKRFALCDNCGEETPRDESKTVDGESYCATCYDEKFTKCESCGEVIARDDAHCYNGDVYCETCYDEHFTICSACSETIPQDESHNSDCGDVYCETCYSEAYTSCDSCGDEISRDDALYTDNGCYCQGCYPEEGEDKTEWDMGHFSPSQVHTEIKSRRKFGVELETSSCPDHGSLEGRTLFGCKEDGSISGMEFVSPALSSDKGLGIIRDFCRLAERNGFQVNKDCGFHAHFDVSRECVANLKSIALAYHLTYDLWSSFVPRDRRGNNYCKRHDWDPREFDDLLTRDDYRAKIGCLDRYVWCNVSAYYRHGTVEIRLHSATLDPEKIVNWVKAHARFIDWAVKHTAHEIKSYFAGDFAERFQALAEIWRDAELTEFYRNRARKFGTHYRALQLA